MVSCFQEEPVVTPYKARPNTIPLDQMNQNIAQIQGKALYYAKKCMELSLDDIDRADEAMFNRIIWHAVKGVDVPYPKQSDGGIRPQQSRDRAADTISL